MRNRDATCLSFPIPFCDFVLCPFAPRHSPFRQHKTKDKHEIDRMTLTMVRVGFGPGAVWSPWATAGLEAHGIRVMDSWFSPAMTLGHSSPRWPPVLYCQSRHARRGGAVRKRGPFLALLGPGLLWPLLTAGSPPRPWSCPTPSPPSSAPCWRGCCRGTSTGDWAAWAEGECSQQGPEHSACCGVQAPAVAAGPLPVPPADRAVPLTRTSPSELTGAGAQPVEPGILRDAAAGAGW